MNTAFSFLGILVLAGLVVGGQSPAPECPRQFLGAWEYRQAAGDGFDAEGERLELSCNGQTLRGLYHGLEREGEHGLFYTLVEVRELQVDQAGLISFVVPERELFQKPPSSLGAVRQKRLPSSGVTWDQLHFQGGVEDGKLVLTCTAKGDSCPDRRMVFGH
ncbi:MAG TPA: hypothetical protein VJ808_07520 [Gemmatimonadales bacterium]|nr:hypothetical protein [Gemmatimonadales bacterium]